MITNERQYRLTKTQAEKLQRALASFDINAALISGVDPVVVRAQLEALKSKLDDLNEQMADFDRARLIRNLRAVSIKELPELLIRSRIAQELSHKALAERLGMKEQQVQRYEAERFRTASLERLAQFIDALQLSLQLEATIGEVAPERHECSIEDFVRDRLSEFPFAEMSKRGWFARLSKQEKEWALVTFLKDGFGDCARAAMQHRSKGRSNKVNKCALACWQARVLQRARKQKEILSHDIDWYDFSWITTLVQLSAKDDGPVLARKFLNNRGVILVVEPHLSETYLDGAAMLLDGKYPVIGLTLRFDRLDNFWFILLHELGHILLHYKKGLERGFIDDEEETEKDEVEIEADNFARTALIPDEVWMNSFVRFTKSRQEIERFANKNNVGVSVVAGRIRRERDDHTMFSYLVGQNKVRALLADTNS